ncbi:MAG: glycosyltransferase [Chlamydiia bacterium]|nr:glycosyltransferase [Chlamydiia bacterium]
MISLCMIYKDEEQYLPQFIQAHRELFNEWILVDTGSQDHSQQIIREAGFPIHSFSWNEDFSAARNYALSLCTGDWVVALDADECIADVDGLKELLKSTQAAAIELPIKNYITEARMQSLGSSALIEYTPPDDSYRSWRGGAVDYGYRLTRLIRVFRRDSGLRWHSPIHEVLQSPAGTHVVELHAVAPCIHHVGMLENTKERSEAKRLRYEAMGKALYARALGSRDPKLLFEAARTLTEPKEKLNALLKAELLAPKEPAIQKALANCYLELKDVGCAAAHCQRMIEIDPESMEGHLALAHCRWMSGNPSEGFNELKKQFSRFRRNALFHYTLAQLAIQGGLSLEARSHAEQARALAPTVATFSELAKRLQPTSKQ